MLKLVDDVDVEKLKEYRLHPVYECNTVTGEVSIKSYDTYGWKCDHLPFKRVKKSPIKRVFNSSKKPYGKYEYVLDDHPDERIDLNILYDLIKDGLVEKGD